MSKEQRPQTPEQVLGGIQGVRYHDEFILNEDPGACTVDHLSHPYICIFCGDSYEYESMHPCPNCGELICDDDWPNRAGPCPLCGHDLRGDDDHE